MRPALRAGAAAAATLLVALAAPPAPAAAPGILVLPKPIAEIPVPPEAFPDKPDRLKTTIVPGAVDDTERVRVGLGPGGAPATVSVEQRLLLHGTGQFVVYQRSSARDVEALDDTIAPVLKREAVIWQGFVDGQKPLAARLTLDPVFEAPLLPLAVTLEWRGRGRIGAGGTLPGPGEVVVRIANTTARGLDLPSGEVEPRLLAGPLDTLRRAGQSRTGAAPPAAGRGLPATLPARDVGPRSPVSVAAPFRVLGTIAVAGGAAVGELPGGVAVPGGVRLDGVLHGDVTFTLRAEAATTLALDLRAFPTVDPRTVAPRNAPTWAAWAARNPTDAREATTALVRGAAEAARAHEYAPYLGLHGRGRVETTFHLTMAPASEVRAASRPLRPKPFPIALAGVALLAVLANGTALWRRL
ncbi:MAG TPA: hypothetical protein VGX28_09990 [Frankiaceae bacterium]|jgi:hypothetical protein|nr:hypothetical protein [Frankiaceae bacterium]